MENKNVKISGSGQFSEGIYGEVRISGSGRATGDIEADSVHVTGSGHFAGVKAKDFRVSGSTAVDGPLSCEEMHISGSCRIKGAVEAAQMHISGSVHIDGPNLRGNSGMVSGALHVDGGVEFEEIEISGVATVHGLLNAERLRLCLNGVSKIGEIGGSTIVVEEGQRGVGLLNKIGEFFGAKNRFIGLNCGSIEGTVIRLVRTECKIVRGETVVIGPDCKIEQVEYTKSLTVDESSEVLHQKQI